MAIERTANETQFNAVCQAAAQASALTEAERQLPTDLARDLARAGMFNMFVPQKIGGQELSPPEGMARTANTCYARCGQCMGVDDRLDRGYRQCLYRSGNRRRYVCRGGAYYLWYICSQWTRTTRWR